MRGTPNIPAGRHINFNDEYIFCHQCHGEYSANPHDYFNTPDDHTFECCGFKCPLVKRGNRWQADEIIRGTVTVGDLKRGMV